MDKMISDNTDSQNPDEINLLEYIYILVKHKFLIAAVTCVGIAGGYIAAKIKGPQWVAEVVIAPKETESQKTPNLSSFGAFGGLVSSQLNIGGNASLDKIDRLLNSRDFNARLIKRYNLLPVLYQHCWPKVYLSEWDSSSNDWKKSFVKPNPLKMGSFLKGKFLKKRTEDNMMTIEISSKDSLLSWQLIKYYVSFLDEDIKATIRNEAQENVEFLDKQLVSIADPLLREKIQSLIADEIEKTMLVSKEAFKIIDPFYLFNRFKEKKIYPVVFGFGMFGMCVAFLIFIQFFRSARNNVENNLLFNKIKWALIYPVGKEN